MTWSEALGEICLGLGILLFVAVCKSLLPGGKDED